jgi:excisionase family DNA binding protein
MQTSEKLTMTPKEIVQATGLGRDYVANLIRTGKLPNVGNTRRFLVPRVAVNRMLEQAGQ